MRLFSWHSSQTGGLWHWPSIYKDHVGLDRHWLHGFYWWCALIATLFVTINVIIYLLMGYATLPFTKVSGINVGMQSRASAMNTLNEQLVGSSVAISINGSVTEVSLQELGVTIDEEATFRDIRNVTDASSLPIVKALTNPLINVLPTYQIDRSAVVNALSPMIEEIDEPAISAVLSIPFIETDPITITPEKNGTRFNADLAADQLITAVRSSTGKRDSFSLNNRVVSPAVYEADLERLIPEVKQRISSPVAVLDESGEQKTTLSPRDLRLLLSVDEEPSVSFDKIALEQFVFEELSLYFFEAPTPKRVLNGVTKNEGVPGRQLDAEAAMTIIMDEVTNGANSITLPTVEAPFTTMTDGRYEKTSAGLQALLRDFDIEKRGDYRLMVHQLRGGDIRASHQGAQDSIPASTYKAFIAYAALWSIEQGDLSLSDQTSRGTIDACMYEMLHHSTDYCAFAIQDYMGWQRIDDILHQAGFEDTILNNEDRILDKHTTPQDEYKLYRGLYDGTLLNAEHTEKLLTILKGQKWRSGIPGGSSPSVVADKVGFYNGWINDVGIVYGDDADYIIVAISDGGSFWEINDLSRRIYNFFEN